jgi:hypothetical protein
VYNGDERTYSFSEATPCHHVENPCRAVGTIHVFVEPVAALVMSGCGVKRTYSFSNDILSKIPRKSFYILQQSPLRTEKFEKAVVIHFAIGVPAARHNLDGGNSIQIRWKAR